MGLCILGSSSTFSAQGGWGKEKKEKPAAKNSASPSEGEAKGAYLPAGREEKIGARKSKIVKKTFLLDSERNERRRGGAFKIRSPDFRQKKFGFCPKGTVKTLISQLAERVGFEPTIPVKVCHLSKMVH